MDGARPAERYGMEGKLDRKAAVRAFKEPKVRSGIYGIRNTATGRTWAGSANDLDATRNGQWLTLESEQLTHSDPFISLLIALRLKRQ